jgi:hypothetical protein
MYEDEDVSQQNSDSEVTKELLTEKWRRWAAHETQLRALLGHYILDSQISYYNGGPSGQRHASNPLRTPCDNIVFEASTVQEWLLAKENAPIRSVTFAELFNILFSPEFDCEYLESQLSSLAANVLLEGLKSLMMESDEVKGRVVGVPTKDEISDALARLHHCIEASQQMSTLDHGNVLLRWHSVCLEAATDSVALCCQMCTDFDIEQKVFGLTNYKKKKLINLKEWTGTLGARRALLHAIAIWDILQDLPLGRSQSINVPASIFTAAIIYCAYCIAGVSVIQAPAVKNWEVVTAADPEFSTNGASSADIEVANFLIKQHDALRLPGTPVRNLLYDLNSLPVFLRNLSKPWGVAATMAEMLEQLATCCGV